MSQRLTLPARRHHEPQKVRLASIGPRSKPRRRAGAAMRLRAGYDARAPGSNQLRNPKNRSLRTTRKQCRGNQDDQEIQVGAPKNPKTCGKRESWHNSIAFAPFND
jgi:hypothetical protein